MEIKKINRVKVEKFSPVDLAIAKALYEKGAYCMKKAYSDNNPKMLTYSAELFMESINLYPKNLEPYVCLGYIALSVNQPELAWKMVKSAEKNFPGSPDIKAIIEAIYRYKEEDSTTVKTSKNLEKANVTDPKKIYNKITAKADVFVQNLNQKKSGFFSPTAKSTILNKPEKQTILTKPKVVSLGIMKPKELSEKKISGENSNGLSKSVKKTINSNPKKK